MKTKKCKHCGTTEDLVVRKIKNKGTSEEEKIYRNICYSCRREKNKNRTGICKKCNEIKNLMFECNICFDCYNKSKLKGICKHCGTTENLITRSITNQFLKEPKIVTQDICKDCFSKKMSKVTKGKAKSDEHKEKLSKSRKELFKDPKYIEKYLEGQYSRYIINENGKRIDKDPKVTKKRSITSKKNWENIEFKEKITNIVKENWKDPIWKENKIKNLKNFWTEERKEEKSKLSKKRLKGQNPFNINKVYISSSKPEQELFLVVKQIFPNAKQKQSVKTKESRRFPDILIEDKKLIIEYDGSYWHDTKKDRKRDEELKKVGYFVVHYIDRIPTIDELKSDTIKFL